MDAELERTQGLIEDARAGRREAYEALFALYRADLTRAVERRFPEQLRARVEVSDVVQETLIDAVKGFDAFEYRGRGSFRRWLASIAENRLRMTFNFHARSSRRELARERPFEPSRSGASNSALADATSPSAAAAASDERARIERALCCLAPDHAEVLRRVKLQGEPLAQVAAAMQRSENAVKKLLGRALLELARELGPRA